MMLKFQEHPVVTGSRHVYLEVNCGVLAGTRDGAHVEVSQVTLAKDDQMPSCPENRVKVGDRQIFAHNMHPYSRYGPSDQITCPHHRIAIELGDRRDLRYGSVLDEPGCLEIHTERNRCRGGAWQELGESSVAARLLEFQRYGPGAIAIHDGIKMLVAGDIPAYDEEVHLVIAALREVGHRPAVTRKDGETEVLEFPGGESRGPRTQQVTSAGDGQPTGRLAVIVVLANAVPAVVMGRRRGATDYRLAEVD